MRDNKPSSKQQKHTQTYKKIAHVDVWGSFAQSVEHGGDASVY
jgi:hypothetical protein